jgi:hypothetical protein
LPANKNKKSSVKHLGKMHANFLDRSFGWRDFIITFLPAISAAVMPLLYGIKMEMYARNYFGPAVAFEWAKPWYALSGFALIPLLWLASIRLRSAHRVLTIYENGIYIQSTRGKKEIFNWREIEGLIDVRVVKKFLGITVREIYRVKILSRNKAPVQLDHQLKSLDEICARIKAKIYPRLLREYRSRLTEGGILDFGSIKFNNSSLTLNNYDTSWSEVKNVGIANGLFVFEIINSPTIKIPVGKIPNKELFVQLIQEREEK